MNRFLKVLLIPLAVVSSHGLELEFDANSQKCKQGDRPIHLKKDELLQLTVKNFNFGKYPLKILVTNTSNNKEEIFNSTGMFQNIPTLNKEDLLKGKSSDKDFKINIFENVESQIRGITVYFENTKFEICDLILKSSKPTLDSNLIEKVQKFDFKSVLSNVIYKFEDVEILIKEKCRKDSTSIYCQKKGDTLLYLKKLEQKKDSILTHLFELYRISNSTYSKKVQIPIDEDAIETTVQIVFPDTIPSWNLPKIYIKGIRVSLVSSIGISGFFEKNNNPVEWVNNSDSTFVLEKKEKKTGTPTASLNLLIQGKTGNALDYFGAVLGFSTNESNRLQLGLCANFGGFCLLGVGTAGMSETKRDKLKLETSYKTKIYDNPNKSDLVFGYYVGIGYAFELKKTNKTVINLK